MKTKHRSWLRLFLGKIYFTLKKQLYWNFSGTLFAHEKNDQSLQYLIFTHQTPLLRKLKNVDMYLQHNKVINLKIAIKNLDGLIIKPNELFSYWKLIGNPTISKGYVDGMILDHGQVKVGVGGGICQLSNLLYWMILHTPLTVIERWRHSYDVFPDSKRSQPFGSGATCAYPNIDLQFKNSTQQEFQLRLKITKEYLIGEWRSNRPLEVEYKIFEKNPEIRPLWGKYIRHNEIYRNILNKKSKKLLETEFITENNAIMMYDPLIETSKTYG